MAKSIVVRNINNVCIAVNEVISRFTINRNFALLLENDKRLAEFYKEVFKQLDIKEYVSYNVSGVTYEYDDIIWFVDSVGDLWLLKCIIDGNDKSPQLAIDDLLDGRPNFEKYGWQDQNEFIDLKKSGILSYIDQIIKNNLYQHENDVSYHTFGKLSLNENSDDYIKKKILLRDLSNIDSSRKNYFFPSMTGRFETDTITNGIYRIWDNGIIEFDLTFRVGYQGVNSFGQEVLSCNNVSFKNSTVYLKSSPEYQENNKYFQTTDDMRIFMNPPELQTYQSQNAFAVHGNRNKYVNTYFADLNMFPKPIQFNGRLITGFADLDYMIFCSDELNYSHNMLADKIVPNQNSLTWCNKTIQSITAIYITMPSCSDQTDESYLNFAKNSGLIVNSFTCHIIGRWYI